MLWQSAGCGPHTYLPWLTSFSPVALLFAGAMDVGAQRAQTLEAHGVLRMSHGSAFPVGDDHTGLVTQRLVDGLGCCRDRGREGALDLQAPARVLWSVRG